ncbi:MAG: hydrolase [Deltaproteobacteria bacterium]|nr:hydrolase [Deltaproteobacteria bacterium]
MLVEQLVQRLAPTRDAVRGATRGATRGGSAFAPPADGQRRAAVAAVLHDEPAGPRVLLMKRAERAGDPWSGHISLPGGGYQADDPDLLATAIRETHEELGIVLGPEQLVGSLSPLAPRTAGPTLVEVSPFVFRTRVALDPICGPEALAAFWLPLELAISGALDSSHVYARGGTTLTFPSWTYEGHVIWGLTRRILDDLVALAR